MRCELVDMHGKISDTTGPPKNVGIIMTGNIDLIAATVARDTEMSEEVCFQ